MIARRLTGTYEVVKDPVDWEAPVKLINAILVCADKFEQIRDGVPAISAAQVGGPSLLTMEVVTVWYAVLSVLR